VSLAVARGNALRAALRISSSVYQTSPLARISLRGRWQIVRAPKPVSYTFTSKAARLRSRKINILCFLFFFFLFFFFFFFLILSCSQHSPVVSIYY
jgi:hypothetical protein